MEGKEHKENKRRKRSKRDVAKTGGAHPAVIQTLVYIQVTWK